MRSGQKMKFRQKFKDIKFHVEEEYGSWSEFLYELSESVVPIQIGTYGFTMMCLSHHWDGMEDRHSELVFHVESVGGEHNHFYRLISYPGDSWTGEGGSGFDKSDLVEVHLVAKSIMVWEAV